LNSEAGVIGETEQKTGPNPVGVHGEGEIGGDGAGGDDQRIVDVAASCGRAYNAIDEIMKWSGVPVWEDLFQTLRHSCEIEWAQTYRQFVVSR
jgi:hypothetical protein